MQGDGSLTGAPSALPRVHPWVVVVLVLLLAAAGVDAVGVPGAELAAPVVFVVGLVTAGVLTLRRSRGFEERERLAWRMVGLGELMAAAGVLVVAAIEAVAGSVPPFGWFDAIFLSAYISILLGLGWLPHLAGNPYQRMRLALDGMIGAVSIGVVLWFAGVGEVVRTAWETADPVTRVLGSIYPLVDLAAFVVVMLVVVRRSVYRFDPRMLLLALAISLQAAADITYLGPALSSGVFEPAYPLFLLATAGFVGSAVLLDRRPPPRQYADRRTSVWWLIAPYSAAGVLVAFLVAALARSAELDAATTSLLVATGIVVLLVVVRQGLSIRENREIVEQQRAALVSSISHELRTPLTAMLGFVSMLDDDDAAAALSPAEHREIVSTVHSQTAYLTRIVSDLVILARGNIERMEMERQEVEVDELVLRTVSALESSTEGLSVDVPAGLRASLDPDRTRQVLVNLLTNAERYGGGRRMVMARDREGDLILEVHDDGPGVPKKHELTVWERFERGPNRLNATVPGSGIGLAIVQAVARQHGGEASYRRSERLGGACFQVWIPGAVLASEGSTVSSGA